MREIRKEFEEILKSDSLKIDEIINIDIDKIFESFGIIKQKIYDIIYKNILYLPISDKAKVQYLEHINFMFTEKEYYSTEHFPVKGINNYSDLHYNVNEHIEFIKKTLVSYSKDISKFARENKEGNIYLLTEYINELKRLSILNTYGINDISKERPFDDFYIDIISNELNFQKQTNSLAIKQGASPRHKKTSTTYQGDDRLVKKLPMLHNRMNGNFIEEVDYKDFEAIFTGQPIESINRKLDWISQPVLLAYFIEKIREFIPFDTNIWVVAENCFTKSHNLRSLANGYQNRKVSNKEAPKKPIHHQVIDDLFINL